MGNEEIVLPIEIKDGKVLVEGEETTNPELIGYAVLDLAEQIKRINKVPGYKVLASRAM